MRSVLASCAPPVMMIAAQQLCMLHKALHSYVSLGPHMVGLRGPACQQAPWPHFGLSWQEGGWPLLTHQPPMCMPCDSQVASTTSTFVLPVPAAVLSPQSTRHIVRLGFQPAHMVLRGICAAWGNNWKVVPQAAAPSVLLVWLFAAPHALPMHRVAPQLLAACHNLLLAPASGMRQAVVLLLVLVRPQGRTLVTLSFFPPNL